MSRSPDLRFREGAPVTWINGDGVLRRSTAHFDTALGWVANSTSCQLMRSTENRVWARGYGDDIEAMLLLARSAT